MQCSKDDFIVFHVHLGTQYVQRICLSEHLVIGFSCFAVEKDHAVAGGADQKIVVRKFGKTCNIVFRQARIGFVIVGYHIESGFHIESGYSLILIGNPQYILGVYERGSAYDIVSQHIHVGESTCLGIEMVYTAVILYQQYLGRVIGYLQ